MVYVRCDFCMENADANDNAMDCDEVNDISNAGTGQCSCHHISTLVFKVCMSDIVPEIM